MRPPEFRYRKAKRFRAKRRLNWGSLNSAGTGGSIVKGPPAPIKLPSGQTLAGQWDAEQSTVIDGPSGPGFVQQVGDLVGSRPLRAESSLWTGEVPLESATNGRMGFAFDERNGPGSTVYSGFLNWGTDLNVDRLFAAAVTVMPTFSDTWADDEGPYMFGDQSARNRGVYWRESTNQILGGQTYLNGVRKDGAGNCTLADLKAIKTIVMINGTYAIDGIGNHGRGSEFFGQTAAFMWFHELVYYEPSSIAATQDDVDAVHNYLMAKWHA